MLRSIRPFVFFVVFSLNYGISNAQNTEVNVDSLITSGIYKVTLTDNTEFTGEVVHSEKTRITFRISESIRTILKSQIKLVVIPRNYFPEMSDQMTEESSADEIKFKNIFLLSGGFNLPTGGASDAFSPGFGLNGSVFHMFDQVIGIGSELSYNNFYSSSFTTNYYETYKTDGFWNVKLSVNLIAGNFKPGNGIIFYGLFGIGLGYRNEGKTSVTYNDPFYSYAYHYAFEGAEGLDFHYGAGTGISYLLSKNLGLNFEVQFSKLNTSGQYYGYDDGFKGYFSFKAGIMSLEL
jgi:hypothetical protein